MTASTQKALIIPSERAPWELRTNWPVSAPGPNEVLVKLVSVALNPVDMAVQAYGAPFASYPYIGGLDGAGVIECVGEGVTNVTAGDKVHVHPRMVMACAQLMKLPCLPLQPLFWLFRLQICELPGILPDPCRKCC